MAPLSMQVTLFAQLELFDMKSRPSGCPVKADDAPPALRMRKIILVKCKNKTKTPMSFLVLLDFISVNNLTAVQSKRRRPIPRIVEWKKEAHNIATIG